jgi:putative resolvase
LGSQSFIVKLNPQFVSKFGAAKCINRKSARERLLVGPAYMPPRVPSAHIQPKFIGAKRIKKYYDIHEKTLRSWANRGKLRHVRYDGEDGKRLYDIEHLRELIGDKPEKTQEERVQCIAYARVSSAHQRADLERQAQDLQEAYPNHEVISDVGSGLNFKRKGLSALLERVLAGLVKEVVVMHKDRLCRFGSELMELIFKQTGTKFVVHCASDGAEEDTRELADDLLAVTTVFVARHNGLRSGANRRRRAATKEAQDVDVEESERGRANEALGRQDAQNQSVPYVGPA